ncbi:unnamed protein product [Auanema sp. JU1783]|nr:unnamed protein product [Auanema sp. JU1783]
MISPGDPLWKFCGFANGSSFHFKYIIDEDKKTFTPCAEFGAVVGQSIPLLFCIAYSFAFVSVSSLDAFAKTIAVKKTFERYSTTDIRNIFIIRAIICLLCSASMLISLFYSLLTPHHIKTIQLIEYGFVSIVWFMFSILWMYSAKYKSWTRSTLLHISTFFGSKVFHEILVNRWIFFGFWDPRTQLILMVCILHAVFTAVNIIEFIKHRRANTHQPLDDYVHLSEGADEDAGLFSKIFFCWTNDLIKKGARKQLNSIHDIFNLPPSLQVATVEYEMVENSPTLYSDGQPYSLKMSLYHTFGLQFFLLGILRIASDIFTFGGPILLHLLVVALESSDSYKECFLFAGLMVLTSFLAAITSNNFNYYIQKICLKVRAATVTSIYDRLLRVPMFEVSKFSSGKIINFVSTDVDRIVNFFNSFHSFWSLPVQMCVALYLLYKEIGMAFLSGVVSAIILVPINKCITNKIGEMSEKLMHAKDQRIKLTSEMVEGIRIVKMSSWEHQFEKKIAKLRKRELYYLKIRKYLDALCVYLWASAPLLITVSILSTYTLVLHEKLTAAKVFTALALVNILIMPLNAFPWVINGLVEAVVSLKRLEWFFKLNVVDFWNIYSVNRERNSLLSVKSGGFAWGPTSFSVKNINFDGNKGSIIGISGDLGSGKSTLLHGLLGETISNCDYVRISQALVNEGFGYLGQERWLCRGTVKDNILAGKPFDEKWYKTVLEITCLQHDIMLMPGGDSYEISDNGSTLSGGQRTRVALARTFYQDNSVILLDEPFASLDRKVADTIWLKAFEMLREKGKLIIVATHDLSLLSKANEVLVINKEGYVIKKGSPSEVLPDHEKVFLSDNFETVETEIGLERVLQQDEEKQSGTVKANIYGAYAYATGPILSVLVLISLSFMQISKNGADWWLSRWTENQSNLTEPATMEQLLLKKREPTYLEGSDWDRSLYFLMIYCIIAAGNTFFTLIRAYLFAHGGIVAAKTLHKNLLHKLLQTSTAWWDRTPAGRVINRLCADVYTVDDNLPFQFNILLASLFNLIGALTISLMGLPFLSVLLIILFFIYFFIQKYYRLTTVELKRLSSLSLSPFYSHLNDTVNGLVTIRAQRLSERFTHLMRAHLTTNIRAQFSSLAASQWLAIRLSLIAVAVVAGISVAAILQHKITNVDSGLVGLAITYALSMTSLLNGLLGSFIETEKEMVSVERIQEYIDELPVEKDGEDAKRVGNILGRISFNSVSLRYDRGSPLALDNFSLKIEPGEKVAICGRTGSGKSTIFQTLLRTVKYESGHVLIDDHDINNVPFSQLRSIIAIVPQHPFIFSGTLFENLTVGCPEIERSRVTRILMSESPLDALLHRTGGLDGMIEEGGKNLSFGEKQVISICRLLLAEPKIVLIDEATSHLDASAHQLMISSIWDHFPLTTVISIVHNTSNLGIYDKVVEVDRGMVVKITKKNSRVNLNIIND